MTRRQDVIVFLGPSLPVAEARRLLRADYRGPARQGDVFRALEARPRAILLVDGVFESVPSVWHHELVAAASAGVALFGASSMGALRAAELPGLVTPLGEIARRFARGACSSATARAAVRRRVLTSAEGQALLAAADAVFYQRRTWPAVLARLPWPAARVQRLAAFLRASPVDLKAADARAALGHLARARLPERAPRAARFSSFVRRTRLAAGGQGGPPGDGREGVRTLLLADFARIAGVAPAPAEVAAWRARLRPGAADVREGWAKALALEAMVLEAPEHFVPDGPSRFEGRALEHALSRG